MAEKLKFRITKRLVFEYAMLTIGTGIAAAALMLFLVPGKIAAGGVSGIATILYHVFGWPVGLVTLLLNIPLFLLAMRFLGAGFLIKSVYATLLYSLLCSVIPAYPLVSDAFLCTIYGGVVSGVGLGLVIKFGGSTGGTDMAGLILNHKIRAISPAMLIFLCDFVVIAASGVIFGVELALYAIAVVYLSSKAIEFITEGFDSAKAYMIITDKSQEVGAAIMDKLGRGATLLSGTGMYTGSAKNVVLVVLQSSREQTTLKREVKAIDPTAFIIAYNVKEVLGEGFRDNT